MTGARWPEWWHWELELSPHLLKRMIDRQSNEVVLRLMLEQAVSCRKDIMEGRWVVETRHLRHRWDVIIEPDTVLNMQVIIIAYPVWEQ